MDELADRPLRGFRQRWHDRSGMHSPGETISDLSLAVDSSIDKLHDGFSDQQVDDTPLASDAGSFEPVSDHQPVGPSASSTDTNRAVSNSFLSSVEWTTLKFPWETGFMSQIFSDDPGPKPNFSMPVSWASVPETSVLPRAEPQARAQAVASVSVFAKHIKLTKNDSYWQQRDKTLKSAVDKWNFFLSLDTEASTVGRQIASDPHDADSIVTAVLGTKSPNTALKRINALLSFHRWACVNDIDLIIPFDEQVCWKYIQYLQYAKISASRATSFVQAVRFSHFVFQVQGALEVSTSRRICGSADIQLASKEQAMKQARPLSVDETKRLHQLASSEDLDVIDRCIVSHLLMMLYGRCRASDTFHVESINHDTDTDSGYVDLTTRCHKGSKAAVTKTMLLPILIPVFGICTPSWVQSWWNARVLAGLPVQGVIKGALQPAPSRLAKGDWTCRPLSSYELSDLLRDYLECPDDSSLSSHSLKSTVLSWAAKCEMPREYRRVLGRHSSSIKESDSVYARELSFAPVRAMERMFLLIRKSEFNPDAARSKFFPGASEPGAAPAFPPTPAFHASGAAPCTPAEKLVGQSSIAIRVSDHNKTEVKEESLEVPHLSTEVKDDHQSVAIVSSSEDESESSGAESGLSSTEDEAASDPEIVAGPGPKFPRPTPGGESPAMNEVWMQHVHLKTVHIVSVGPGSLPVTNCGRKCSDKMTSLAVLVDWTLKCRVCFRGRRLPK